MNEKIIENAERSICFQEINTFEDLYKVLRTNVSTSTTVSYSRAKLQSTKKKTSETMQTFTQRFTQVLSELRALSTYIHIQSEGRHRPSHHPPTTEDDLRDQYGIVASQ